MKHVWLLASVLLGFGVGSDPPAAQTPADTSGAALTAAPETLLLIPAPRRGASGVRIRSVRDHRGILIIRAPTRPVAPAPMDSLAWKGIATYRDLSQLEARLIEYLDRRLTVLERPSPLDVGVIPRETQPLPGRAVSRSTTTVPLSVVAPPRGEPRAVVPVDTVPAVVAAADTTDTAAVVAPSPSDTTGLAAAVLEIERAILDTELFSTTRVSFETNRAELLPASVTVLNPVGIVLQRHPEIRLEVQGHTDSRGSDEYNMALSLRRAEAVCAYLVRNFEIDSSRVTPRGYGESQPVAGDDTATGRALNRRVQFVLIR